MKIHLGFFVAYDLCIKLILITYNTKALKILYPTVPFNNKMVHFEKNLNFVAASEQTALRHKGYNYLPHFCYYWMAVWSSPFLYVIELPSANCSVLKGNICIYAFLLTHTAFRFRILRCLLAHREKYWETFSHLL